MSDIRNGLEEEVEFWRGMVASYEGEASDDVVCSMREALSFAEFKLAQMTDSSH